MTAERRLGRFYVLSETDDYELLRVCQEGCAVIRCEYLAWRDAFEVIAEHPEFEPVAKGTRIPCYMALLEYANAPGGPFMARRTRFDKQEETDLWH